MSLAPKDLKWIFSCSLLILGPSSSSFPTPSLPIGHVDLSPEIPSFFLQTYSAFRAFRSDLPSFLFKALFNYLGLDALLSFFFFFLHYFVHNSQVVADYSSLFSKMYIMVLHFIASI